MFSICKVEHKMQKYDFNNIIKKINYKYTYYIAVFSITQNELLIFIT